MAKDEGKGTQDLQNRAKDLEQREEAVKVREKHLDELQEWLDGKEKDLTAREKALPTVIDAEPGAEKPLSKDEQRLIEEGCKAWGIAKEHLFHARIDVVTREAVLVTNGGAKVRYKKGDEVEEPLDPVRVDGISRKKPRHVAGKKKGK